MYLFILGLMTVWVAGTAFAQSPQEVLGSGSPPSGFDIVSAWQCTGGKITVKLDNGPTYTASYGVIGLGAQGICSDTNKGGTFLWNWHPLDNGSSTLRASADASSFTLQLNEEGKAAATAASSPLPSLETRLRELKGLREKHLITPDEYYQKRAELLKGL